jgi:hypothetical protein
MKSVDKITALLLVAIAIFLLYAVRTHERLSCVAEKDVVVVCERVQTRVIASTDEHFRIPDPLTVMLSISTHTTSGHAAVNTSVIQAMDMSGRKVILLSVPESNVAYAEELEKQLHAMVGRPGSVVIYDRDESRNLWLFLILMGVFASFYAIMLRFRNRRKVLQEKNSL